MIARRTVVGLLVGVMLTGIAHADLPEARIGVVLDGPASRTVLARDQIRDEIAVLIEDEWRLVMGEETTRLGDWTLAGAHGALEAQLADESIDIVLTLGVLGSQAAADRPDLSKPVIAAAIADPELQGFPLEEGASGKRNLVYLTYFRNVESQLRVFHRAVEFSQLAVLVDENTLEALPQLTSVKPREIGALLGVEVTPLPVGDDVESLPDRLAGFDAVYITPLLRFGETEMRRLGLALAGNGIPTFSLLGGAELDWGFLMTLGSDEEETIVIARRIALNVQRILLGDRAEDIPVRIEFGEQLVINMTVAAAIGYEPSYAILADAQLINEQPQSTADRIGFSEALTRAAIQNRSLLAASFGPDLARTDYLVARSALLPQLGFEASRTQIDADRANPLVQPERSTDLQLSGRQLLYSDDVVADWRAAERLVDASFLDYRSRELDVIRSAGEAYLQVLRADALFRVRRENLETTRQNLRLARVRERIGFSSRADLLRWQSQLARERRDVIAAEAALNQALVLLGQSLGMSQAKPPQPLEEALDVTLTFFRSHSFARLIDTPRAWERFKAFLVSEALARAPEIAALDERIVAQDRQQKAARRKFFLPELALQAGAGERIDAGGAGSGTDLFTPDDRSWSVAVTASWPVFTGGALRSRLNAAELQLARLQAERFALAERIELSMRLAVEDVGASYTAIELTEEAARAARENLEIVADAYGQGAASITDLLDAQDASLNSELSAADARYTYFIDLMAVLRAAADFRLVLEPDYRPTFVDRALRFVETPAATGENADAPDP